MMIWGSLFAIALGLRMVKSTEWQRIPQSATAWGYFTPAWFDGIKSARNEMEIMVDITNALGISILQDYSNSRGNFAFSPYGMASVLVVLYEGSRGESANQIRRTMGLPVDKEIMRVGFRDIHRRLRSYFSHEGFLSGITLNKEGSSIKPEYKMILKFYGYKADLPMNNDTKNNGEDTVLKMSTSKTTITQSSSSSSPPSSPSSSSSSSSSSSPPSSSLPTSAATFTPVTSTTLKEETNVISLSTILPTASTATREFDTTLFKDNFSTTTIISSTTEDSSSSNETDKPNATVTNDIEMTTINNFKSIETTSLGATQSLFDTTSVIYASQQETQVSTTTSFSTDKIESQESNNVLTKSTTAAESVYTESTMSSEQAEKTESNAMEMEKVATAEDEDVLTSTETSNISTTTATVFPDASEAIQEVTTIRVNKEGAELDNGMLIPQFIESTTPKLYGLSNTVEQTDEGKTPTQSAFSEPDSTNYAESKTTEETAIYSSSTEFKSTSEPTSQFTTQNDVTDISLITQPNESSENEILDTTSPNSSMNNNALSNTQIIDKSTAILKSTTEPIVTESGSGDTTQTVAVDDKLETTFNLISKSGSIKPKRKRLASIKSQSNHFEFSSKFEIKGKNCFNKDELHKMFGDFDSSQTPRRRRNIIDYLTPSIRSDLSLQLQNGMYNSHVFRNTNIYRHLPRRLFLVDGSYDAPVPMMTYTNVFRFGYIPRLHSKALEFPLDDIRYKLLILLPIERRGLRQLLYDLEGNSIRDIVSAIMPTKVKTAIPAFMVEGFVILTSTLQKLGIWDVFDPRKANLTGMSSDPELFVRNVEQSVTVVIKNYVEILDIQTRTVAARHVIHEFEATHPFAYFVLDAATNVALMAGQLLDPLNSRIY